MIVCVHRKGHNLYQKMKGKHQDPNIPSKNTIFNILPIPRSMKPSVLKEKKKQKDTRESETIVPLYSNSPNAVVVVVIVNTGAIRLTHSLSENLTCCSGVELYMVVVRTAYLPDRDA